MGARRGRHWARGRLIRAAPASGSSLPEEPLAEKPLPEKPLLSVVVPVYQVESYLAECLDSLLGQTYTRLEIVLVDDGSTDGSSGIADAYAARDPRIVLVRQENAGLGAARNAGLERCTGDLVTFADSDDTVPPLAYERMVRALQRSGSDFAVGAIVRSENGVNRMRPWVRRVHAHRRLAVTIDEAPELLNNVFACTKVFRRDFVDRIGMRFPVGIRYEDQVPITRAYLRARSFDVLTGVVYRWRVREDRTSITQQKTEIEDLVDRLATQREIAGIVRDEASAQVRHQWYVKAFRSDFLTYLQVAGDADDSYWQVLHDGLVAIALSAPPEVSDDMELRVRLAVWLGRHGHREALHRLVRYGGFAGSNFPVTLVDGALQADLSFLGEPLPPVPDSVLRVRQVDLRMHPHLESLDWSVPGVLGLRCVAAMPYVDARVHDVTTTLTLTGPAATVLEVSTRVAEDPHANLVASRAHEDHSRSRVAAALDLSELVTRSPARPVTRWTVGVSASVDCPSGSLGTDAVLETRREHGSAVVSRRQLVDGALVTSTWVDRRGLLVEVRRQFAAATGVHLDAGTIELTVLSPATAPERVLVGDVDVHATVLAGAGPGEWRLSLPVSRLELADVPSAVRLIGASGDPTAVLTTEDLAPGAVGDGRLRLVSGVAGELLVERDLPCVMVDDLRFDVDAVLVSGQAHRITGGVARLVGSRWRGREVSMAVDQGRFTARLPVTTSPWGGPEGVLPPDGYQVQVTSSVGEVPVAAGRLFTESAARPRVDGWEVEVAADRRLRLRRHRHTDAAIASRFEQTSLRTRVYGPARRAARRERALFECFDGTGVGDGPLAVCEALRARGAELELVWSVRDTSVTPPPGTMAVVRGTSEWYDALGSARLLVNNNTFPDFFEKGAGQVYVQTWHGTPLKRIGADIMNPLLSTEHYLRRLRAEAESWDMLVSSSPYCTDVFRQAFGQVLRDGGRIRELGRPSNDPLVGPGAGPARDRVRQELGIPDDQTVVLYAPTWRDDAPRGSSWEKVLHLDHALLTARCPEVTVLVRGHPNTSRRRIVEGERVLDVTAYPDIARLYLAADVLVTDYSAAMVDFTLLDRPIIVLAPDLEAYRDRVRGLYVDLVEVAPGPVVRSTAEVIELLDDDSWSVRRKQMRTRLCPWDDGSVADRVAVEVLEALSANPDSSATAPTGSPARAQTNRGWRV